MTKTYKDTPESFWGEDKKNNRKARAEKNKRKWNIANEMFGNEKQKRKKI